MGRCTIWRISFYFSSLFWFPEHIFDPGHALDSGNIFDSGDMSDFGNQIELKAVLIFETCLTMGIRLFLGICFVLEK